MLNLDNVFHSNEYPQLELHVQGNLDAQQVSRAQKITEIVAKTLHSQQKKTSFVVTLNESDLQLPSQESDKNKEFHIVESCCEKILKQLSLSQPQRRRDILPHPLKIKQQTQRARDTLPEKPLQPDRKVEAEKEKTPSLRGRVREISSEPPNLDLEENRLRMQQASDKTKKLALGIFLVILAVGAVLTLGILAIPAIGVLVALSTTALATVATTTSVAAAALGVTGGKMILRQVIFGENTFQFESRIAHLHGDRFIRNTNLEGNSPLMMMMYLSRVLTNKINHLKKQPPEKQETAAINRLEAILKGTTVGLNLIEDIGIKYYTGRLTPESLPQYISPIQNALNALKPGESIIFPSGWDKPHSNQGHTIYLECIRDQNGTFRLKVYNTGEGLEYHDKVTEIDPNAPGRDPKLVTKCHPYIEIGNIAPERMTDPTLWRALIEIRVFGQPSKNMNMTINYSPEDLYEKILPSLRGEVIKHPYDKFKQEYIELQHAGICTWWSLRTLVQHHLPEIEFEQFEHEIQTGSLSELMETFKDLELLKDDEQARLLMQKSAEHLSTRSLERYKSGVITLADLELANSVIAKVDSHLKAAEVLVQKTRQATAGNLNFAPIKDKRYGEGAREIETHNLTTKEASQSFKSVTQIWDTSWQPEINKIETELKAFCESYSKTIKDEPHAVYMCLRALFLKLPMPKRQDDVFWSKIPPEKILSCMDSIAKLSELMAIASSHEKRSPTRTFPVESTICLHKGLAIQHKLATGDKELQKMDVGAWGLPLDPDLSNYFSDNPNSGFFNIYDTEMLQQLKGTHDYLGSKETEFFNVTTYGMGLSNNASARKEQEITEEGVLIKYCQQHRPEFENSMGKQFAKLRSQIKEQDKRSELERRKQEEVDRASLAMGDWNGSFLPPAFCFLKRQVLATHFNQRDRKISNDFFATNPYVSLVENGAIVVQYQRPEYEFYTHISPHEYTQSRELSRTTHRKEHDYDGLDRTGRALVHKEIFTRKEVADMFSTLAHNMREGDTTSPELKIVKIVQYLKTNISKLAEHDVQLFLREAIFKRGELALLLKNNPDFLDYIFSLIKTGYKNFTDPTKININGAAFMVYLGQLIHEHVKDLAREQPEFVSIYERIEKHAPREMQQPEICLKELLKLCKNEEEESQVYQKLIYHWSNMSPQEINNLSSSDPKLKEMVTALGFLQAFPLPEQERNYHLESVVDKFRMLKILPKLRLMDENHQWQTGEQQALAIHIMTQIGLDEEMEGINLDELTWEIRPPLWIGQHKGKDICVFNYQNCSVQLISHQSVPIPLAIKKNEDFKNNFPKMTGQTIRAKGLGLYEFNDEKGNLVRIKQKDEYNIIIQRQFKKNGPWYEYVREPLGMYHLKNHDLTYRHTHWISVDAPERHALLCKPGTAETTHQVNIANNGSFDITHPHDSELKLISNIHVLEGERYNLYAKLGAFESEYYTHVWVNRKSGQPQRIEMAQVGLDFNIQEGDDGKRHAFCVQEPGFYIAENQYIKDMGSFKGYLILQNKEGKIKILIPRKEFAVKVPGALSTDISLQGTVEDIKTQFPRYYTYGISEKEQLKPMHEAGRLFLGAIFLGQRRYKEAQNLLREGEDKRYSKHELDNFSWMISLHRKLADQDPRSLAVFLTFLSRLYKNYQIHGQPLIKKLLEEETIIKRTLKDTYKNYLSSLNFMAGLVLTYHEELTLVREMVQLYPEDSFMKDRLALLTKSSETLVTQQPEDTSTKQEKDTPTREDWIDKTKYAINDLLKEGSGYKHTHRLFTRPDSNNYGLDFEAAYKRAKSTTEQDQTKNLMALELEKSFNSGISQFPYTFLISVAQKPDMFPDWITLKNAIEADKKIREKEKREHLPHQKTEYDNYLNNAKFIYDIKYKPPPFTVKETSTVQAPVKVLASLYSSQETIKKKQAQALPQFPSIPQTDVGATIDQIFSVTPNASNEKYASEVAQRLSNVKVSKEYTNDSSLHNISLKKLMEDISTYSKQPTDPTYMLKDLSDPKKMAENITQVRDQIELKRINSETVSKKLAQDILELANQSLVGTELEQRELKAMHIAEVQSSKKEMFTIDGLCILFLKNNPKDFKELNPSLSQNDIDNLRVLLTAYLNRTVEEQVLTRQVQALDNISAYVKTKEISANLKDDPALQELCARAAAQISSKSAYDPTKAFSWLIFEYYTGFRLREDQVNALKRLLESPNIIQEAIMGTGKSTVWLVLLMIMLADGKDFPVTLIPPAQYNSTISHLRKVFGAAYKKIIRTISFNRNTDFTVLKLQSILDYLENTRVEERTGLFSTPHIIKCIALKRKEALLQLAEFPNNTELVEKINLLQMIILKFQKYGRGIFDEADIILNARLAVNFTIGDGKPLDRHLCLMISNIYEQLRDPEIMRLIKGDPLLKDLQLLPTDYHGQVKGPLLQKVISAISKNPADPLHDFFKTVSESNRKLVMPYLLGTGTIACEQFVKSLPDAITRDLLALIKEELNNMLPFTLNKLYRVDYGSSQKAPKPNQTQRSLAIPYSGNDNPVETSEFASPDIRGNFSIQTLWREGISTAEITALIKTLQIDANTEKDRRRLNSTLTTAANRSFEFLREGNKELADVNLFDCDDDQCALIAEKFNTDRITNPARFMYFLQTFILPQITTYSKQITATSQDLVGMFKSVIGFTGTPLNFDSYPQKLRENTRPAEGVVGKIAVLLSKKTEETTDGIRILEDMSYPGSLSMLIRENDSALIEAGAILNGHTHEEVAKDILALLQSRKSDKKGVIFFRKNTAMILEKTPDGHRIIPLSESLLKPEERFTYYDQSHTTGIDISQPLLGMATLTIGKDTSVRDKAQGAYRMRAIDKKQGLSLIVSPEAVIRTRKLFQIPSTSPIKYEHIYGFANNIQTEQQLTQLMIATKDKISAVIQQEIDKRMFEIDLKKLSPEQRKQLIQEIAPFLASDQTHSPFANYGEQEVMMDRSVVIEKLIQNSLAKLEAIGQQSLLFQGQKKSFIERTEKLIKAELSDSVDLLPSKLSSHMLGNKNTEGQVEKEHQKEQQQDVDMDLELTTLAQNERLDTDLLSIHRQQWWIDKPPDIFAQATYAPISFKDMPGYDCLSGFSRNGKPITIYALDDICAHQPDLVKIAPLMKGIIGTVNRFPIGEKNPDIMNRPQLPAQYVLYIRNKKDGTMKLQLLDPASDLSFFWSALNKVNAGNYPVTNREVDICLCDINGEVINADKNMNKVEFEKSMKEYGLDLRVRAKLFLGEFYFSPDEEAHIQKLIKTNKAEIESIFRDHVLQNSPMKLLLFKKSELFEWLGKPAWVNTLIKEACNG